MTPIEQFRANIARVRHLGTLFVTVKGLTLAAVDLSDILRAELVMAVSALDHLVHELTRVGMLEVYHGVRPQTDAYRRFRVPMGSVIQGLVAPNLSDWFDGAVREAHGWLSFQRPDKIADAIRLFSSTLLWDSTGAKMGIGTAEVKVRLQTIADRRNKIAHEADLDPTLPGATWPIDEVLVNDAVDFIEALGEAFLLIT